jgi:hypothetical protein
LIKTTCKPFFQWVIQQTLFISDEEIGELQIIPYEKETGQFVVLHLPLCVDTFVHHGM